MEDLFYLTKSDIGLKEVLNFAKSLSYVYEILYIEGDEYLNVSYEKDRFWQWTILRDSKGDLNGFEPTAKRKINQYNPSAIFMISLHPVPLEIFSTIIKKLVNTYGGWIAIDDSEFTKCDLENLENIF